MLKIAGNLLANQRLGDFCAIVIENDFNFNGGQTISKGNRTEWSPTRSVIIQVITKSDDRAAEGRFVYHEYELDDTNQ